MGLFSSKKNNNQPVVQDETYFEPVAEIEGGIPVGRIEPEVKVEEVKTPEIIFDDFPSDDENEPTFNTENLHNPIEDFMPMQQSVQQQMPMQQPMMQQSMQVVPQMPMQQPMMQQSMQVAPQMPMQQSVQQQMPYNPNYCFIKTAAPLEDVKEESVIQNEVVNPIEERADRTSKFFSDVEVNEEEPYYKRKEKVAPITGTTSIFNIGMIPTQNNNEDKRL